jgi:hypothetical protein
VISGECRVEGVPSLDPSSPSGRKLALDGLRLQLDLRIVPSASGDATAAAIWRIDSEAVATLPLCTPAGYRRLAMAVGLAVLIAAVGVWFLAGPSAPSEARWSSEPIEQSAPSIPPPAPAGRASPARTGLGAASPRAPGSDDAPSLPPDAATTPPVSADFSLTPDSDAPPSRVTSPPPPPVSAAPTAAPRITAVRPDGNGGLPTAPPTFPSTAPSPAPNVSPGADGVTRAARSRGGKVASPGAAPASGASPIADEDASSPERGSRAVPKAPRTSPDALRDLFSDTK